MADLLKSGLHIFTFIFLLAMVSTLFQVSGLFEEDTAHAKTELSKKDSTKEGGDDGDEDAADSDYLAAHSTFNWSGVLTAVYPYTTDTHYCGQTFTVKNTPPPKG